MGHNTVIVVMNDALHNIERDVEFGPNLVRAIHKQCMVRTPVSISAGGHANAATVLSSEHASYKQFLVVGGNWGERLDFNNEEHRKYLKSMAKSAGYNITKKRAK